MCKLIHQPIAAVQNKPSIYLSVVERGQVCRLWLTGFFIYCRPVTDQHNVGCQKPRPCSRNRRAAYRAVPGRSRHSYWVRADCHLRGQVERVKQTHSACVSSLLHEVTFRYYGYIYVIATRVLITSIELVCEPNMLGRQPLSNVVTACSAVFCQ